MTRYPYTVITGQGLGFSNSSLQQVGDILPSKGFGQGDVKLFVNAANGNLVVQDRVLRLSDQDGAHEFSYIFNSLGTDATNAWRLAWKQFAQLPATNPPGATAVLTEADGHQTTYTLDQDRSAKLKANLLSDTKDQKVSDADVFYFAPGLENGTPWLRYDYTNTQWIWYHPGTQITEIYNPQGFLMQRTDAQGRSSTFEYTNGLLSAVNAPSGTRYELRRATAVLDIYAIKNSVAADGKKVKTEQLLQAYAFDNKGRLATSTTEGRYTTSYQHYQDNTSRLSKITQSDNTTCVPTFQVTPGQPTVINMLRFGATNKMALAMSNDHTSATVTDGFKCSLTLQIDNNARVTQTTQEHGYDHPDAGVDTTTYQYANTGQLGNITRPDLSQEIFAYNNPYGLCTSHTQPNGQVTNNIYQAGTNQLNLIISTQVLADAKTSPITRYVYDDTREHFLRFEISPLGRVIEYRPDNKGNRASMRSYFGAFFPVNSLQPGIAPSAAQMLDWVSKQDPAPVSLTDYQYDYRGLCDDIKRYTVVDEKGNGVVNANMAWEQSNWDDYGSCLRKQVLQKVPTQKAVFKDAKENKNTKDDKLNTDSKLANKDLKSQDNSDSVYAVTTQQFDTDLHRLISVTDAQANTTAYNYTYANQQAQVEITRPNLRTETKQVDTQGAATSAVMATTDQKQSRNTSYMLDTAGRRVVTTHPDQSQTFTYHDRQNRLGFEVSCTGIVVQHEYDRGNRFHKKTQYNNTVDITSKKFWPDHRFTPEAEFLIKNCLQPDAKNDRVSFEFFDTLNRLYYQVDALGYITRTIYDSLDRHTGTVLYAAPASAAVMTALQQGQDPQLAIDVTKDRFTQYFYDNDNKVIGQADPVGYVTEYIRDAGGRVTEKIRYALQTTAVRASGNTLNDVRPAIDIADAHTYKFYDNRDQCICEVDPEGYITTRSYLANGKPDTTKRYAISVPKSWYDNKSLQPTPVNDGEDQTVKHQYDLLGREVLTDTSVGKDIYTAFDNMGHTTLNRHVDVMAGMSSDPDHMRTVETQYDGWEQTTAEANPYVGQQIAAIEVDGSLTPAQKAAAIAQIWATQSLRHTYDPLSGLKLYSTNTLGNMTYYYYNLERKLVVTVDPTGAVKQNTNLNTFGDVLQTRQYSNRIDANTLKTLTGGFVNTTIINILKAIQNDAKDAVINYQVDQRGQATQVTDAEGNVTINQYNAFKQCVVEQKPVDQQQPTLTITHDFDTRGLERQTTKQNGNLTTTVQRHFVNMYGKTTDVVDECGARTNNMYDRLGRVEESYDPLGQPTEFTHDAFNRVSSETDPLGQTTQHVYNQAMRTHTILPPIKGTQTTIKANAMDEKIAITNALGQTRTLAHAPDGKIVKTTDALKNSIQDAFDTESNHITHTDEKGVNTQMLYNGAKQLRQQTLDEKISTELFPDAFGNNVTSFDPNNVVTQNSFDRRSLLTQSVQDAGTSAAPGLCLTTQQTFNGQRTLTSTIKGDSKVADQYDKTLQQDGLNRAVGNVVDPINATHPQALNIATQKSLDLVGRVVAEKDPNGNVTRSFYDLKGQLRFKVDAMGGITESIFNVAGKQSAQRIYATAVDPAQLNDQTTLAQLQALVVPENTLDSYTRFFQDANGRERFCIEVIGTQGIVREKRYDAASREVTTITYAQMIDVTIDVALTTDQLVQIMAAAAIPTKDRVTQKILDENGRARFIIDPVGAITEQIFDKKGRVITKIAYAIPLNAVTKELPASPEEMKAKLAAAKNKLAPNDSLNALDRTTFIVFDNADREIFRVAPEGNVTQSGYDNNNNLLTQCQYAQTIVPPADYNALVAQLNLLTPNSAVDRITTHTYDNGNRRLTTIDPNGNKTVYTPDALGQVQTETKADASVWASTFDRANRKLTRTAPGNVTTEKAYDKNGNALTVTNAKGLANERTFKSVYNACNNLMSTQLINITPDSKDQKHDAKDVKDLPISLVNAVIRNAKQQIVAKQDQADSWVFYVRDNQGRKVFQVDNVGNITEYVRAYGFKEVTQEIRYANKFANFDFTKYTTTGIPLAVVQAAKIPSLLQDVKKNMEYDRRGLMQSSIESSLSLAKRLQNPKGPTGDGALMRHMTYDMFSQKIEERDTIDAKAQIYNNTLKWFDRNGNVVAECDANGYVKRYYFNAFNKVTLQKEFVTPLAQMPTLATTLLELDQAVVPKPTRDHIVEFTYDKNNNVLSETRKGVVVQLAVQDAKTGVWSMQDQKAADLNKIYTYNTQNKCTSITHENGKTEYSYYDLRGNLLAHADVPRDSFDKDGNPITLTPLTVFTVNELNQTIQSYQYAQGAQEATKDSYKPFAVSILFDRVTKFTVDKLDRRTGRTVDPSGLNISTTQRLNAGGKPIAEVDANGNTQRHFYDDLNRKRFTIDAMGRVTEWNYDAFNNIQYQRHYSNTTNIGQLSDQTTLEQVVLLMGDLRGDADAQRWFFYDTGNRERFRVDVVQTPTASSNLDSKNDSKLDSKADSKKLKSVVTLFGVVTEKRYDLASREVQTTGYNQTIDVSAISTMTTDQLVQIMSGKVDTQNDRTTYTIRDLKGQPAYIVDPMGFLTVQTFDLDGKVLSKTAYYTPVPQSWFSNPTVPLQIPASDPRDQVTYNVYNPAGQLECTVDPEGGVTKTGYDNQKSKIAETKFNNRLNTPFADYPTMLEALAQLTPDAANDCTKVFVRDAAGQLIQKVDARGNSDLYTRNIFGKTTAHTDRNGNITTLTWDNANRLTVKTWPPVTVAKVQKNADGKLSTQPKEPPVGVQDVTVFDKAGNVTSIIKAAKTSDARTVNFGYDATNQRASSTVQNAMVDDPSQASSFSNRPEKKQDVTTQTIFDPRFCDKDKNKNIKMYEKDENDQWTCYVRDSAGRLAYQINPDGSVIQCLLNSFGEIDQQIHYATAINFSSIATYIQTGTPIPLTVMQGNPPRDSNDRTTTNSYDKRSDKIVISKDAIFTYSIATGGSSISPNTAYQYDAFRNCTVKTTQQTATTSSTETTWFNRNNKKVAVADPNQNLKFSTLDTFSQETGRMEYANAVLGLAANMTAAQVKATADKNPAATDRSFTFGFNLNGKQTSETLNSGIRQVTVPDEKGKPTVKNLPGDNYTRSYQFSKTDKQTATIYEDSTPANPIIARTYFDARDHEIAATGIPRQTSADDPTLLFPLTVYELNAHGQRVQTSRYVNGTNLPNADTVPTPKALDPNNDHHEYVVFNERGLPAQQQNAAGYLTGHTFTAKRKLARKFYNITTLQAIPEEKNAEIKNNTDSKEYKTATTAKLNLHDVKGMPVVSTDEKNHNKSAALPKAKAFTTQSYIDEQRLTYDPIGRPTRIEIRRSNAFVQSTDTQYNTFGDAVLDGGSDAKNTTVVFPIYRKTDQAGNIWLTNARPKNNDTAVGFDLQGKETINMVSATNSITPNTQPADLPSLIALPITQIERTETQRNAGGGIIGRKFPATNQLDATKPRDLPLQIQVNQSAANKTLLTWAPIQIGTVVAKSVYLYPLNKPELKKQIPIQQFSANRFGVDVSDFDSDIYQYEIEYTVRAVNDNKNVDAKSNPMLFKTQGRVEFATNTSKNSQAIVATVKNDTLVYLSGNTKDLTAVDLYQGDKKIGRVNVKIDPTTQALYVDLTQYSSGSYSIKPILVSGVDMPQTSAVTIYTPVPAQQTISREIPCAVQLAFAQNKTQARLIINNLPAGLAQNAVTVTCLYVAQDGKTYTQTSSGKAGSVLQFPHTVQGIQSLSVALKINDKESIPLYTNMEPATAIIKRLLDEKLERAKQKAQDSKKTKPKDAGKPIKYPFAYTHNLTSLDIKSLSTDTKDSTANLTVVFSPQLLLYISPWNNAVDNKATDSKAIPDVPVFEYCDVQMNHKANWKKLPSKNMTFTSQGLVINVGGLAPGNYPFLLQGKEGIFTITLQGGAVFSSTPFKQPTTVVQKTRAYQIDAWKNVIAETDSNNNTTQRTYTSRNQVEKITQPYVTVTNADGSTTSIQPVTQNAYNLRGFKTSTTDANNNTATFTVDSAGQMMKHTDATQVWHKQTFDLFGRVAGYSHLDVTGTIEIKWQQTFSFLNQLIRATNILAQTSRAYDWDELGHRRSETDECGFQAKYIHDALGNVVERYTPTGYGTAMSYDRNRQLLIITNPDGSIQQWNRNFFGRIIDGTPGSSLWGYQDLSGAQYFYFHDSKGQVITQTSQGGNHGQWMQFSETTEWMWVTLDGQLEYMPVPLYTYTLPNTPGQSIRNTYAGDKIITVVDSAQNKTTTTVFDNEDRPASWQVVDGSGSVLSRSTNQYDSLSRTTAVYNNWMQITKGWDAVGNLRYTLASLNFDPTKPYTTSRWNDFDAANRLTKDGGILQGNQIVITKDQGLVIQYQNGFRYLEEYVDAGGNYVPSYPAYNMDSLVTGVIGGTPATFEYYLNGTLKQSTNNNPPSTRLQSQSQQQPSQRHSHMRVAQNKQRDQKLVRANANTSRARDSKAAAPGDDNFAFLTYDNDGNILTSNQQGISGGGETTYLYPTSGQANYGMAAANEQVTKYNNNLIDDLIMSYIGFDTLRLSSMAGTRTAPGFNKPWSIMDLFTDPNGIQNGKKGAYDKSEDKSTASATRINATSEGRITSKDYIPDRTTKNPPLWTATQEDYVEAADGDYLGSGTLTIGEELDASLHVWESGHPGRHRVSGNKIQDAFAHAAAYGMGMSDRIATLRSQQRRQSENIQKRSGKNLGQYSSSTTPGTDLSKHMSLADPITRIDGSYMPSVPEYYDVKEGDTFENIAQSVFRDTRAAGDIAALNSYNLATTDSPEVGDRLRMPQEIESRDDTTDDSIPYQQFINTVLGNLRPDMKNPQPLGNDNDDDWWKSALEIVVTMVAVVAAQYWAAPAILTAMSGTAVAGAAGTTVAVGATATAATAASAGTLATTVVTGATAAAFDAAAQGVLSLTGVAPFSIGEVIETGLTAGASAGLGSALNVADKTVSTGEQVAKEMARYGAVAVEDQIIEMKRGLEHSFSVASVVSSMAAGVANFALNSSMTGLSPGFLGNVEGNFVTSVVDQGINAALVAPPSLEQFVSQAIGSSIGTATGIALGDEMHELTNPIVRGATTVQNANQNQTQQTPNATPSRQIIMTPAQQAAQNAIVLSAENIADQKLPGIAIDGSNLRTIAVAGYDLAQDSKMMSASAAASNSQTVNAGQVAFGNNGVALAQAVDRAARFNQPVTQATNSASIWSRVGNAITDAKNITNQVVNTINNNADIGTGAANPMGNFAHSIVETFDEHVTGIGSTIIDKVGDQARDYWLPKYQTTSQTFFNQGLKALGNVQSMESSIRAFSGSESDFELLSEQKTLATESFNSAALNDLAAIPARTAAAGLGVTGGVVELAMARNTVNQAPAATRDFVAEIEYGAVVSGILGAYIGANIMAPEVMRPVTETLISPRTAGSAMLWGGVGSGLWRVGANWVHEEEPEMQQAYSRFTNG